MPSLHASRSAQRLLASVSTVRPAQRLLASVSTVRPAQRLIASVSSRPCRPAAALEAASGAWLASREHDTPGIWEWHTPDPRAGTASSAIRPELAVLCDSPAAPKPLVRRCPPAGYPHKDKIPALAANVELLLVPVSRHGPGYRAPAGHPQRWLTAAGRLPGAGRLWPA